MRFCRTFIFSLDFCILLCSLCTAQLDTMKYRGDTALARPPDQSDTLHARKSAPGEKLFHPSKSPWLAVGLSAALPGAGQLYDENYWKVPVIWGLGGYWIYEWVKLNNKYKDFS